MGILFLLLLSALFETKKATGTASTFEIVKNIISSSLPSVLTFAIVVYLIVINSVYKEKLIRGHVATEYYSYSSFSSLLILIQVGLLIKYIIDILSHNNNSSSLDHIILIFSTINILVLAVMHVILQYFSTDG